MSFKVGDIVSHIWLSYLGVILEIEDDPSGHRKAKVNWQGRSNLCHPIEFLRHATEGEIEQYAKALLAE